MGDIHYHVLEKHKADLISRIDFNDIKDTLYQHDVLTLDEYELISEQASNRLKMCLCMDVVQRKTKPRLRETFIRALDMSAYQDMHARLADETGRRQIIAEKAADAIMMGGVPRLVHNYYRRVPWELRLLQELQQLNKGQRTFLEGFSQVGKTNLAASVLRNHPELLFKHFDCLVYWLDLGDVPEVGGQVVICKHMQRLQNRLEIRCEQYHCLEVYKDNLLKVFPTKGLLVLDNVRSIDAINAFDIGRNTLIITSSRQIIKSCGNDHILELPTWNENETFNYLEQSFKISRDQLPEHLRKVHNLYNGHPNLIALLVAVLKRKPDYLNNDEYLQIRVQSTFEKEFDSNFTKLLRSWFETLRSDVRKLFEQLVVFSDQINILPAVLSVLWQKDNKYEIEEIMDEFVDVSLVERIYDSRRKIYVYAMRKVVYKFLQTQVSPSYYNYYHDNVLQWIDTAMCQSGNVVDPYIASSFWLHVAESQRFSSYSPKFYCLKFLECRLRLIGVPGVLNDFRLYGHMVANISADKREAYRQFVTSLSSCAELLKDDSFNLRQRALRLPEDSLVYQDALKQIDKKECYFSWKIINEPQKLHTIDIGEPYQVVCFESTDKRMLVGMLNGDVHLYDLEHHNRIKTFKGHTKVVTSIQISPCKKYFITMSDDGTLRMWETEPSYNESLPNALPTSPTLRHPNHISFFDMSHSEALYTYRPDPGNLDNRFTCATFRCVAADGTYCGTQILAVTSSGSLAILSNGKMEPTSFDVKKYAKSPQAEITHICMVGHEHIMVIVFRPMHEKHYWILMIRTLDFAYVLNRPQDINDAKWPVIELLASEAVDRCVVVCPECVFIFKLDPHQVYPICLKAVADNKFTCAAFTPDGRFLATGSNTGLVHMWDVLNESLLKEFSTNDRAVIDLDTSANLDSMYVLLSGNEDRTVNFWSSPAALLHLERPVGYVHHFCTYYTESMFIVLVGVCRDGDVHQNVIHVYSMNSNDTDVRKLEIENLTSPPIHVVLTENKVLYFATTEGDIFKTNIEHAWPEEVLSLNESIKTLKCLKGDDLLISLVSGKHVLYRNGEQIEIVRTTCIAEPYYLQDLCDGYPLLFVGALKLQLINIMGDNHCHVVTKQSFFASFCGSTIDSSSRYLGLWTKDGKCAVVELKKIVDSGEIVFNVNWIENSFEVDAKITCAAFSYNADILALGTTNGNVVVCDARQFTKISHFSVGHVGPDSLMFSPEPSYVLIAICNNRILWRKIKDDDRNSGGGMEKWLPKPTGTDLACIKIPGSINNITADKYFKNFVTMDRCGVIHRFTIV